MLPESNRLRSKRDFRLAYKKGRSFANPMLVLYVRPTRGDACRIGFSISKKLGGAVERNRIKRRLREVLRAKAAKLSPGFDVILVGRVRLKDAPFNEIDGAVVELLNRAKMLANDDAPKPIRMEKCDP